MCDCNYNILNTDRCPHGNTLQPLYNTVAIRGDVVADDVTEPITVQQAKDFTRIDTDADDAFVLPLIITAARQMLEAFCNIGFVPHDITAELNNPNGRINLPYAPVIEVESIKDRDGNDIAAGDYSIEGGQLLYPKYAVITYTAGYGGGEDATVLPDLFKRALAAQITWMYNNRGDETKKGTICTEAYAALYPKRRKV